MVENFCNYAVSGWRRHQNRTLTPPSGRTSFFEALCQDDGIESKPEATLPKELRFVSRAKAAPQIRAPQFRDLRKAISLAFQIEHWKPSYSLAMVPHGSKDRCEERVGYDIFTTCLAPRKFAGKSTAFHLLGSANKLEAEYESGAPLALISMRGKSPEYIGSAPPAELHRAVQHITAGLYSYITVISDPPGQGYADVHVMGFECDLDPEEFPEVTAGRN